MATDTPAIVRPSPQVVAVLLRGWNSPMPPGVPRIVDLPEFRTAEIGKLWHGGIDACVAAWLEHREFLLEEANRLQIKPVHSRFDQPMWYGEFLASAGARPAPKGSDK
jgi:hypothetical protein